MKSMQHKVSFESSARNCSELFGNHRKLIALPYAMKHIMNYEVETKYGKIPGTR